VNSYWMCDHGRLNTFKFVNENRIDAPYIRSGNDLVKAEWKDAVAMAALKLKSFKKDQVAYVGSAFATCEDNYMLSKLGGKAINYFKYYDENFGDEILRRSDITPNSLGADLVGLNGILGYSVLADAINKGKIKAIYLLEDDLVERDPSFKELLGKLDLFIYHSTNFNETAKSAHILFPSAAYAEKNGTVINFDGRIQRLRPAVATEELDRSFDGMSQSRLDKFGTKFDRWAQGQKRDAKASWKILSMIGLILNSRFNKYQTAEDVFDEISKTIPEFRDLDYRKIGSSGTLLKTKYSEPAVKV
jgi:NADH-quinone oxidoreductase subunit G